MVKHCTQCGEAQPAEARFCPRCGAATVAGSDDKDPMIGKVVADRYLLVQKIGQGGSGTIYRGEHTTLRKKVAIKILHHQLSADETAIERFRREATTVGEIDNEHILQVLDFGRSDDKRLFFAMEYLEGETLTKVLERDGKLAIDRVVDIATQTAEALMEAHGLGYIHRDLRPRNIFLTTKKGRRDFVKLLDFGLAKLIVPDMPTKQTALGMTFGDARYMSPEQARGETVDRRADIYSLGAILFEAVTGQPPYTGKGTFEILQKHLDDAVPSARALRPDCPPWLDAVIQRAMAKKPDDRFVTVLKLIECLKERKAPMSAAEERTEHHEKHAVTAQMATATATAVPQAVHAGATLPIGSTAKPAPTRSRSDEPARSQSGQMDAVQTAAPSVDAATPSVVVVDGSSKEKTAAIRPPVSMAGEDAQTIPIQRAQPAPLPPAPETAAKKEPTGEWFSESGKFEQLPRAPGGTFDDDEEFAPKKNKSALIIGGVAGGLTVVGAIVILMLPKPEHKPLRGEAPANPPQAAAPAPAPTAAAPAPAAAAPAPAAPAPAAVAAKPESPKPEPKPEPAPEPPKPVVAEKPKPAAKPEPAPKPEPAKPVKVASAEPRKRDSGKLPDGFKDPFAGASAPKAKPEAGGNSQAEFFCKLGRQKLAASELGAAAANFQKAREYDPKSADAFAGLGEVAFEQGDYNGAKVNLLQALRFSPNRPRYLVLLGQSLYKLNRPREAVEQYKKALRIDPNNSEAQHSLEVAERKLAASGG